MCIFVKKYDTTFRNCENLTRKFYAKFTLNCNINISTISTM